MLTIKHIGRDGVEFLAEAGTIEFWPGRNPAPPSLPHIAQVTANGIIGHHSSTQVFCEGVVYVMNERGRTIATYRLGTSLLEGTE